jgi:hypothetical protein
MNIVNRITWVVAGLIFALCALFGGNELRAVAQLARETYARLLRESPATPPMPIDVIAIAVVVVLGIAALSIGIYTLKASIMWIRQGRRFNEVDDVMDTSICFTCFTFLFGLIVGPVGNGIWAWINIWDFLLLVGFLPTAYSIKDILIDVNPRRNTKEEGFGSDRVTRLHKK